MTFPPKLFAFGCTVLFYSHKITLRRRAVKFKLTMLYKDIFYLNMG